MIHICLYSFGKDQFLSKAIQSIKDSTIKDIFIDLYIYNEEITIDKTFYENNTYQITHYSVPKNYAQVTNISLRKAVAKNHEYFLLLNTDTFLKPDCLKELLSAISSHKDIGVIGGWQTEYNGSWNTPNTWTLSTINKDIFFKIVQNKKLFLTSYVQGACMMFHTDMVNTIGFFEEDFDLFYEETEFCRRVLYSGKKVGILETAKVKHVGGSSWSVNRKANIKRDILYLSNQILFESTESVQSFLVFLNSVISVVIKQLLQVARKQDRITINLYQYPHVLTRCFKKVHLLKKLYRRARLYKKVK